MYQRIKIACSHCGKESAGRLASNGSGGGFTWIPFDAKGGDAMRDAAPALLAALKDIITAASASGFVGSYWTRERVARAEAAIAKAEGRTP